jgi:hypothetical protein
VLEIELGSWLVAPGGEGLRAVVVVHTHRERRRDLGATEPAEHASSTFAAARHRDLERGMVSVRDEHEGARPRAARDVGL